MQGKKGLGGIVCSVMVVIGLVLGSGSGIRTNQAGLELIGNAEGCRLVPYTCPAGRITAGIGHTGNVEMREYTYQQVADMWISDIKSAEKCVNENLNGAAANANQFSAMTSLVFNVGCRAISRSTMAKYANAGNWPAVCDQFPRWRYAGGVELPGLATRRNAERALCLRPTK